MVEAEEDAKEAEVGGDSRVNVEVVAEIRRELLFREEEGSEAGRINSVRCGGQSEVEEFD